MRLTTPPCSTCRPALQRRRLTRIGVRGTRSSARCSRPSRSRGEVAGEDCRPQAGDVRPGSRRHRRARTPGARSTAPAAARGVCGPSEAIDLRRHPGTRRSRADRPVPPALASDADLLEVIVVDDDSTRRHGRGRRARRRPRGRRGRAAARLGRASRGRCSGASRRRGATSSCPSTPTRGRRPGSPRALAAALRDADLVTAGAALRAARRPASGWLHPAMLATLVYRFGPPDAGWRSRAGSAARRQRPVHGGAARQALLAAGGYAHAAGHMTDDAALARGARAARLARRLPRRRRADRRRHARVGARDVARVGTLARAAGRHLAGLASGRRRASCG